MNLQTQKRVEAVKAALQNGERKIDITTRFCREWNVSTPAVVRVMGMAQKQLLAEMLEKKDMIEKMRRQKITEAAEEDIISELEADTVLCNIILGKTLVRKMYNTVSGIVEMEVPPDHATILKALDMYYKRMGSYKLQAITEEEKEPERVTGLIFPHAECEGCPLNPDCCEECEEREIFLEAGGDINLRANKSGAVQYAPENNVVTPSETINETMLNEELDREEEIKGQKTNGNAPPDTSPITGKTAPFTNPAVGFRQQKRPFPPPNRYPRIKNYP